MPTVQIECPHCAWEDQLDEAHLGRRVKCSKCGTSFVAEAAGDYGLVAPPAPPRVTSVPSDPAPARGARSRPQPEAPAKKADPKLERLMEQWAEEE